MDWPKLDVTERVGRATETVPTPRGSNGALAESHPPDDRMAHAQCAGSVFRNTRRRVYGFPIYCLRPITRPLAREEERLAHIAELASGRSEAEEKAQEREKNGTSGVHGWGRLLRSA
jgi:hypothetical protein